MTEEELKAIEAKAKEAAGNLWIQETGLARDACETDIPALVAEVRRLQKELAARDAAL